MLCAATHGVLPDAKMSQTPVPVVPPELPLEEPPPLEPALPPEPLLEAEPLLELEPELEPVPLELEPELELELAVEPELEPEPLLLAPGLASDEVSVELLSEPQAQRAAGVAAMTKSV